MGWLEGINRRGEWAKPLTSLPTADRPCWKIFFEIRWEDEIDDQTRRKIRSRKNRKSLKNKNHRTATERLHSVPACSGGRKHALTAPFVSRRASITPICSFSRYTWSSEIDKKSELEKVEKS